MASAGTVTGNQAFVQAALAAQAGFRPGHAAAVPRVVVVVAQKVKETMKGQNAQLGGVGMAMLVGLPAGDAVGNDNVPQRSRSVADGSLPPEGGSHTFNLWLPV